MQDRFKFRVWQTELRVPKMKYNSGIGFINNQLDDTDCVIMQCTGLKDKNGKLIYEGDIIVIPNQYPFYDYKNKEESQNLNDTNGGIKGETILNYVGVVEWIYSQWQYVYHCVNQDKNGISEGINNGINDYGYDENKNTEYLVIGNIYENKSLLESEAK